MVENMSASGMPSSWALSRSTSKYNCGISACRDEDTPARALSCAAYLSKVSTASTRFSKVAPLRASTCNSKPPDAPKPGMMGGVERNTCASGYLKNSARMSSMTSLRDISPFLRSSHGLRMTVSSARDCAVPTRGLLPVTFCTWATAGCCLIYSMARSVTLRVRSSVAPSGRASSTLKYPWSSSGRKLPGITRLRTKIKTMAIPNPATMRRGWASARCRRWMYLWLPRANQSLILRNT